MNLQDSVAEEPLIEEPAAKVNAPKRFKGFGKIPKLTEAEAESLKEIRPYAITMGGPLDPIPGELGDDIGTRPVRIGTSGNWADSVTAQLDSGSPVFRQELLGRVWLQSREDAKRLLVELPRFLATVSKNTRGDWHALNSDVDLVEFMIGLEHFAASLGLKTMDDEAVLALARLHSACVPVVQG